MNQLYSLVSVLLLTTAVAAASHNCAAGFQYNQEYDRCYKFVATPTPFVNAEEYCKNNGAHLISIRNAYENVWVSQEAKKHFGGLNYFIGGTTLYTNKWYWTDNTTFSYTDWMPGEPIYTNQCILVSTTLFSWYSTPCMISKPFVCAVPATACPPPPQCPVVKSCASGWTLFAGSDNCYKVFFGASQYVAERNCNNFDAHLASIHSSSENNFIAALASTGKAQNYMDQAWIGITRTNNGTWSWTDGTQTDYANFAGGNGGPYTNLGNCAEILADEVSVPGSSGQENQWNIIECSNRLRAYVCKKPARIN